MGKNYQIILADPPWDGLGWNNGSGKKAPARHYPVQGHDWIKALPIQTLTQETCALFLWVTFPNLVVGLDVINAWGFSYATCAFTWVKKNKKSDSWFMGCGNYTRANAELCLLGTKGNCQKMRVSRSVRQICDARIGVHSRKPPEIRERIVELFGDVPRIELFARETVPGWDALGFDIDGKDIMESIEALK